MRRVLPAPVLSAWLFVLWLLLRQSASAGTLLLGGLLALALPALTAPLRPTPVRVRRPGVAVRLLGRVLLDALRSSFEVAAIVLGLRAPRPAFVRIPLDVRDPNALAVLSMIVTATPGTAWAEIASDRSWLVLHVLSVEDEAEVVATIKHRYERPLMEIFE